VAAGLSLVQHRVSRHRVAQNQLRFEPAHRPL
jgi:hypothetical protein